MARADGADCGPGDFVPVNLGFEHTKALKTDAADAATLVFYNCLLYTSPSPRDS